MATLEQSGRYLSGVDDADEQAILEESHYKMSKKIAQLTRVIGMLVNKNEEQEYEKQYLSEAFEVCTSSAKPPLTNITQFKISAAGVSVRQVYMRQEASCSSMVPGQDDGIKTNFLRLGDCPSLGERWNAMRQWRADSLCCWMGSVSGVRGPIEKLLDLACRWK